MQVSFRMNARGSRERWVIEIDPIIRKKLGDKRRILAGFSTHRFKDYIEPIQCYLYGHTQGQCIEPEQCCRNCLETNSKLETKYDVKHGAVAKDCPVWISQYVVAVEVSDTKQSVTVVYFSPSRPKDLAVRDLDQIPCTHILVGGYVNTNSLLWGPDIQGHRRPEEAQPLVDLIIRHRLNVWNEPNWHPTFETTNGRSWIDITAISVALDGYASSWRVIQDTLSDHNYFAFTLGQIATRCVYPRFWLNKNRAFKVANTISSKYSNITELADQIQDIAQLDEFVQEFTQAIKRHALLDIERTRKNIGGSRDGMTS
ncbi:uncharacterized protein CDAR_390911 [Caerostris darwini]|uniref:Endonuclease/exonuclease/phosphatase domain-containing protein n=1 Tax=Caerostris darwini TaxID=1538125 RepID=A0AAV4UAD8_9ARAC|nr:uncharacterized protein CDAR_390911 [Caerostris darwini]